jgi:RNA polymerase sigma-70 factor (ECF subfamily)
VSTDTSELVTQAAAGDSAAFTRIVAQYRGLVFSLCLARTANREEAEDWTQDVFVSVYQHLPALKQPEKFLSWLRRITVNTCNLRQRECAPAVSLEEAQTASAPDGLSIQSEREIRDLLARALGMVSENSRHVLSLRYVGGYSYREIAAFLEVPISTVKSRLHEGRQQIKEELLKVIKELLCFRLSSDELAEQVLARCGGAVCSCARELLGL